MSLSKGILLTASALTISISYALYKTFKSTLPSIFSTSSKGLTPKSSSKKESVLALMKHTPLVYIKSLSELTGCNIYAKCEYYLPYTSKDRMIKNIILDAEK